MRSIRLAIALSLFAAVPLRAQGVVVKEARPGLMKRARVSAEAATATALARVPGGTVQSADLEEDKGRIIYSFDIKVAGRPGVEEVAVDAVTGKVLSVAHETPADEAKEKAADAAKARGTPAAAPATRRP
ncbi:MAG: PepSY domain-containing protein [Gemmatimonadetes bacterium]|nr:PepSY domain-containing protein [Gemmatimonadota bacterium]